LTNTPKNSEQPLILLTPPIFRNTRDKERITPDQYKKRKITATLIHSFVKIQKLDANLKNSNLFSQSQNVKTIFQFSLRAQNKLYILQRFVKNI